MNNIVFSDWKRDGAWWFRSSVDGHVTVTDQAARNAFRVFVCGTLLGGTFTCPDAAREAADAHLVSQGRLDKSRAFVRLGEWEEDGVSYYRTKGGTPWHHASMAFAINDLDRARKDAELVASGALDPSRAFRAGPTSAPGTLARSAGVTGAMHPPNPPRMYNSVPPEVARAAKPAWGEWEKYGSFYRRLSAVGHVPIGANDYGWVRDGESQASATDIDDAREKADAFLVARGELEAGRAFKRVGDWREAPDGSMWRQGSPSAGRCITDAGKAAADAELVRRGLLAEERAFKVANASGGTDSPRLAAAMARVSASELERADTDMVLAAIATELATPFPRVPIPASAPVTVAVHLHTGSITVECEKATPFVVNTSRRGGDYDYSLSDGSGAWIAVKPGDHLRYTVTDGRGTFSVIGARPEPSRTWADVSPWPSNPSRIQQPVTLANWEHHLPALLANAPREFRDGFNRRRGPAWEAYLVALAGVKEHIQMNEIGAEAGPGYVIAMASRRAQKTLGPEWVKANARESLPEWEAVSDSRMGHR